jgi:hypothetical protein
LLYDLEREAGDQKLGFGARRALRQAVSKPILDSIRAYLEREQPLLLPKRPDGQAIAYLRNLLERINSHPKSRLAELFPDQWKAGRSSAATS